jgi:hypothetical protein
LKPLLNSPEAQITGPYSHDNLSIFLIHQDDARTAPGQAKGGGRASKVRYLTLQAAMKQKKVVVYETKQVNELAIENVSVEPVLNDAAAPFLPKFSSKETTFDRHAGVGETSSDP